MKANRRSRQLHITPYLRSVANAPWSARGFSEKWIRQTTLHCLTASRPGLSSLRQWGFVDTRTLSETSEIVRAEESAIEVDFTIFIISGCKAIKASQRS